MIFIKIYTSFDFKYIRLLLMNEFNWKKKTFDYDMSNMPSKSTKTCAVVGKIKTLERLFWDFHVPFIDISLCLVGFFSLILAFFFCSVPVCDCFNTERVLQHLRIISIYHILSRELYDCFFFRQDLIYFRFAVIRISSSFNQNQFLRCGDSINDLVITKKRRSRRKGA